MYLSGAIILASFTAPERVGVNPQSVLWLFPLVASIAVVYKATKVPEVKALDFLKECVFLFGSIVVFMVITAIALLALTWVVT